MVLQLDCTPGPKHKKPTERGNSHILAILESFSNHVRLFAVPDPNAKLMAECLLAYISVHSMPLQIITDNGPEFANQLMTELALMLGLKHSTTSPYNSKANGRVEVAHKSMQTMMRAYMEDHVEDWDLLLPLIEFALNTSINKGTGYTPFFLHFGRHPIYPIEVYNESVPKPTITVDQYVKQLQRERQNVITWVDNYQKTIAGKRKDKYDKDHRKSISLLKLGDTVRILNPERKGDFGKKYNPILSQEVFLVVEDVENGSYVIRSLSNPTDCRTHNIRNLKKVVFRHEISLDGTNAISAQEISLDDSLVDGDNASLEDQDSDTEEYSVDRIIGKKSINGIPHYNVQFTGYRQGKYWYPIERLNCNDLINKFEATQRKRSLGNDSLSSKPLKAPKRKKQF